jgi:hypothetical protein
MASGFLGFGLPANSNLLGFNNQVTINSVASGAVGFSFARFGPLVGVSATTSLASATPVTFAAGAFPPDYCPLDATRPVITTLAGYANAGSVTSALQLTINSDGSGSIDVSDPLAAAGTRTMPIGANATYTVM